MERIITIGREYGSGGREIGRRLAEKLQFAFFDYQIVTELAKRTAFAEEYILSIQEKRPYPVLPVPTVRMWAPPNPMLDQHLEVFLKESEVIRDMADKAPLRDRRPLRRLCSAAPESPPAVLLRRPRRPDGALPEKKRGAEVLEP